MNKTIDNVRSFWYSHPLGTGLINKPIGTKEWYQEFDQIKTIQAFCGDLSRWVPKNLKGKRVLDVGCGPGYWNRIFGRMPLDYYGIDISPRAVELANISQELYGCDGYIGVGNAEQLDFPDSYFHFVISEGVIHHTHNTKKCVDEIYRVLVPGGSAAIGVYYKNLILRSSILFKATLLLVKSMKLITREGAGGLLINARSPDEFIRMYDGAGNPVGKAFTKPELKKMFTQFSAVEFTRYYFWPLRNLTAQLPHSVCRFLNSRFGFMILGQVRK